MDSVITSTAPTDDQRIPTPDDLRKLSALYRARPDKWLSAVTGESVWWKQQEIMLSVAKNPRTAVASCNSAGKSFISSRLACWFLNVYEPSVVITTAPTTRQVEKVIWREIMRTYMLALNRGVELGPPPLMTEWKLDHDRYAIGFSPREYDPDAFQGYHQPYMLIIGDEAAGLTEEVFTGINSVVRGSDYRILLIGNPTTVAGSFYNAFKSPGWWTTHISAFQSPNVTKGRTIYPGVINQRDIDDAEIEYGRDSWQWRVYIEGRFPDREEGTLISLNSIAEASERKPSDKQSALSTPVEIGADIARFGSDSVVFIAQRAFNLFASERHKHKSTMESVGLLGRFVDSVQAKTVRIDTVGVGAGVLDRYREVAPRDVRVVEMIGSAKAKNHLKYANAVTEWWDHLANLLKGGFACGELFDNKALVGDLASRRARMMSNGLMMLESKDETKKRTHRSPDYGDAAVMACATGIEGTSGKIRLKTAWARHLNRPSTIQMGDM